MPATRGGNRRQTLGVVSNTARSRRESTDAPPLPPDGAPDGNRRIRKARVSMIPRMGRENNINMVPPSPGLAAATASSRRKSVKPGGDKRRQTMGVVESTGPHSSMAAPSPARLPPGGAGSGVRNDPRPIHDKAFQQDCIKKLLNFLLNNGYEYPVSQKCLLRPSARDFAQIVTFMLRLIDPSFQENKSGKDSNPMKMEDEIAMQFKALGYPIPLSKTALVAAGSPHTWPTLLAALAWLVELLEIIQEDVDEEIDIETSKPFESLEDLQLTTDRVFFSYLDKAYAAFLEGDEPRQNELINALASRFEKDDGYIEQEIERVTDLNAAIVERMNQLIEETKLLPEMIKKRDDYVTDVEQFHDLIRQLDDHIKALDQKSDKLVESLEQTNQKLGKKNEIVDNLKNTLEKQAVSLGDMYKLQSELKGVEEAMDRATARKEKLRKSIWEGEEQLNKLYTQLQDSIAAYNITLSEVALLPGIDEEASNLKVVLDKNQALEKDQSKLLGVNLAAVVHPTLVQYKERVVAGAANAGKEYQQALDDLQSNKQQFSEYVERLQILEAKRLKLEERLENESQTYEAKLAVRLKEVEALESSVGSINDPVTLEGELARKERQVTEMETLRLKKQEENLANKKAVEDEIAAACQDIMENETFMKAKAAEVNQYWLMKTTMCSDSVKSTES